MSNNINWAHVVALEVHGCREESAEPPGRRPNVVWDEEAPTFWGVYVRMADGTVDWLSDFPTREEALDFALETANPRLYGAYHEQE